MIRWLQWATIDLQNGLGGVEMHARCLARELRKLGVDAQLSHDPAELQNPKWDVIHTHGSGAQWIKKARPDVIRVQAIHGTTLGRMSACHEWFWVGGHLATAREITATLQADVVLADHSELYLYALAKKLGKTCAVASNGWDSYASEDVKSEPLPGNLLEQIAQRPFWVFYGRGADPVKGADRLIQVIHQLDSFVLVASPGEGFPTHHNRIIASGKVTPGQLKTLSSLAQGLILTSYYEGLPLVVLEALGQGMPVVCTRVGGLKTLSPKLQGLYFSESGNSENIISAIKMAEQLPQSSNDQQARALHNQSLIKSWKDVAQTALKTVQGFSAGTLI